MNVKHRRLLALGLTVAFVAAMGGMQYALAISPDDTGLGATAKAAGVTSSKPLAQTVGELIRVALSMVGSLTLILVIYAGFLWMTAQGEPDKVKKAKAILGNAAVGMIIVFGAYSINDYVFKNVYTATQEAGGAPLSASEQACMDAISNGSVTLAPGVDAESSCRGQ